MAEESYLLCCLSRKVFSDDKVQVLFLWTTKCSRETFKVVSLNPSTLSYCMSADISASICLLKQKGCSTLKWNSGFFPDFNSRDQTLMIPRAFSSVLRVVWMQTAGREDSYFGILVFKAAGITFPEMSSVGQRTVLIMPRLQVWSPCGHSWKSWSWWSMWGPFQLKIFCESMINFWFVSSTSVLWKSDLY